MAGKKGDSAYTQAAASGQYERGPGLSGKYDHVRRRWEEETNRLLAGPFIEALLRRKRNQGEKTGLMDLGCGSGDGLETFLNMRPLNGGPETRLIAEEDIGCYHGLELNEPLLEQARKRYSSLPYASFQQADLSKGLPEDPDIPPCDIYFSSFGTLSHFHDDEAARLFAGIARHANNGALVIADWIGRYSYEWKNLWNGDLSREQWMDYRISYIYPKEQRRSLDIDILPLRLAGAEEARRIIQRAEKASGVTLAPKKIFDRSLLAGRHIDTGEYNGHEMPIRETVNRLFEPSARTNLERAAFEYRPHENFPRLNRFFEELQTDWNLLISYARQAFEASGSPPPPPEDCSPAAAEGIRAIRQAVKASRDLECGDIRAEVMEPQLAYALRQLEISRQQGNGCGHGLTAVFEVSKT